MAERLGRDAAVISQDWYYHDRSGLPHEEMQALNFDHPDAFDHALLHGQLLSLKAGQAVPSPRYDYAAHARAMDAVVLEPRPILLIEGLLVLHDPRVRALLDYSVFVDVPAELRLERRIRRDTGARAILPEETLRLYHHCVRPMHDRFVQPSARHASAVWDQAEDPDFPQRFATLLQSLRLSSAPETWEVVEPAIC